MSHAYGAPHPAHVKESAVIPAHIDKAASLLLTGDFKWWKAVTTVEGAFQVGQCIKFHFKDKAVFEYRVVEISLQRKSIVLELVSAEPAFVATQVHTLQLREVTATGHTFFEWMTDFSADVTQEVLQDSKFKKLEAFKNFSAALGN